MAPCSEGVRTPFDVAAADIPAALHRYQTHVHRGHLGVAPALRLRKELLQRVREQLIRRGILSSAHELPGSDLVEDCGQLMQGAYGTQDVVLQQLHNTLETAAIAADQCDLVGTTLRDGIRDLDGRVRILNRAPRIGREPREGLRRLVVASCE